ncbi:hypothetical protein EC968_006618 [Mortierella alpina]|nr:hypothetical protein EC968_006618 [Mortierella alpina]
MAVARFAKDLFDPVELRLEGGDKMYGLLLAGGAKRLGDGSQTAGRKLVGLLIQSGDAVLLCLKVEVYGRSKNEDPHALDLALPDGIKSFKVVNQLHESTSKVMIGTVQWSALVTIAVVVTNGKVVVGPHNTKFHPHAASHVWLRKDGDKDFFNNIERQTRSKFHKAISFECPPSISSSLHVASDIEDALGVQGHFGMISKSDATGNLRKVKAEKSRAEKDAGIMGNLNQLVEVMENEETAPVPERVNKQLMELAGRLQGDVTEINKTTIAGGVVKAIEGMIQVRFESSQAIQPPERQLRACPMKHEHNDVALTESGNTPNVESYSKMLDRSLWTKKEYLIICAAVLFQAFAYSFESNMYYSALSYVTAYLISTSIGSILPTILQILRAALVPFFIKFSDVCGRAESISIAMLLYLIGITIQGAAKSFVQVAVGQIFYGMGSTDTTHLIDRGLMFALWDVPSIASVFIVQALTDPLTLPKPGEPEDKWRRAFLVMGIVSVIGAAVLLAPLWHLQRKALRDRTRRFERRSVQWLLHEFDVIGALLLALGMSLTLLPMILANSYEGNWKNGKIIAMICSGIAAMVLLVIWEAKYTDRPIMSMKIWGNRTAFGALVIGLVFAIMSSVNYQYLALYLVVSRDVTYGDAYLLERGYPVVWTICQLITAFLMKRYNTCRPFVWIGIAIHVIGVGLMIPARLPTASDAFVVISQAIAGGGAGIANVASTVAVTGIVDKKDVATVIGAQQVLSSIGYAIGGALAGGVWTQYLPKRLEEHITSPYDEHLALNDPLKYIPSLDPVTKGQLVNAYADSQMLMSIITCCLAVIAFLCAMMMQHVDLLQDQPDRNKETSAGSDAAEAENANAMELKDKQ